MFRIQPSEGIPCGFVVTATDDPDFCFTVDSMYEAQRIIECEQVMRAARAQIKASREVLALPPDSEEY